MGLESSRNFLTAVKLFTMIASIFVATSASADLHAPTESDLQTKFSSCDELYQQRTDLQRAEQALECYTAIMRETRETNTPAFREAAESAAQSAFWIYHHGTRANRAYVTSIGTRIANDARKVISASGIGPYWGAVFQILRCSLIDTVIPYCFYKSKQKIISDLNIARNAEPEIHGAGPARMLSVIYRDLPKLLGGDLELAEQFMREAVNSMPNFSSNLIESAKLALQQDEATLSRRLLSDFLANNCRTMDPSRVPECESDRARASKMLRKISFLKERPTP